MKSCHESQIELQAFAAMQLHLRGASGKLRIKFLSLDNTLSLG